MSSEKQLIELLQQVLHVAGDLIASRQSPKKRISKTGKAGSNPATGIYAHTSKYNPWRAYQWCPIQHKAVYLGAFPTIAAAKKAQRDFREGKQPQSGTRVANHRAPLRIVGRAS